MIERAREVLHEHESANRRVTDELESDADAKPSSVQLSIFTPLSQQIVDRIREANINGLTPIEALNLLYELKKQLD